MKKIGLYGIGGLFNYGCEAIVRGTYEIIRNIYPDSKIVYYSMMAENDREQIKDIDIEVKSIKKNNRVQKKIKYEIEKRLGCNLGINKKVFKEMFDECDIIFSIGGDMYTIHKHLRNKEKYYYYNSLVEFSNYAISKGKKVVLFGASIGPFGNNKNAKEYYFDNLKRIQLIVCREEKAVNYLKKNDIIDNAMFFPDPAFFVKKQQFERNDENIIGLNLSPLSINELYGEIADEKIELFANIIEKVIKEFNTKIVLLPHVINKKSNKDNDYLFLKKIKERIDLSINDKVDIVEEYTGFVKIKKYISKCDIVISARMHCGINAISQGIPTIFLAYSDKAYGMSQFVYNNNKWVVSMDECEEKLFDRIKSMLECKDDIKNIIEDRLKEIQNNADWDKLKKNIEELIEN